MRTRLTFTLIITLTVLIALTACRQDQAYQCTDEWGCAIIEQGQTIQVGFVGPITGDYSNVGIDLSRGAELAIQDHPSVKGFDFELVIEDTQGSSEQGAAVANKFAADPRLVAVDGHVFSGSTEAAIPIYEKAGIVMMSPGATNPTLTELGSQVFNRVAFTDRMQGEYAARYIYNTLSIRKIAIMHDGGTYGQGLAQMVADFFEALGGQVVAEEAITPGETDYSAPLAAVAGHEPELVYYGGYDADAAVLVTQKAGAGMSDVIFFGGDGTHGLTFLELAGKAADGFYTTSVPIPESGALDKFRAAYLAAYNQEQGILTPFTPYSYDALAVLLNAIEKVAIQDGDNLVIPRKALADAVRSTQDHPGLTGAITCSDTGECAAASIIFAVARDGKWELGPGQ